MGKLKYEVFRFADNVGLSVEYVDKYLGNTTITIVIITDDSSMYYEEWVSTTLCLDDVEDKEKWLKALEKEIQGRFPKSFKDKLENLINEIEKEA